VAYLASPESSCTGNRTVGSNPTPSAMPTALLRSGNVERTLSCPAVQVLREPNL